MEPIRRCAKRLHISGLTWTIYGLTTIDVKAKLVLHEKRLVEAGGSIGVAELKVWEVPRSGDYPSGRKFRLFFVVDGNVVVGFDNHKPKGPHLHFGVKKSGKYVDFLKMKIRRDAPVPAGQMDDFLAAIAPQVAVLERMSSMVTAKTDTTSTQ